jgi:hypothetical protein
MAVYAEERVERPVLEPAREDFLILGIAGVAVRETIPADIRRPVRNAGNGEIQSRRNLMFQRPEIAVHVARPRGRGIALLAKKGRAGQDKVPLLLAGLPPVFIDAKAVHERKNVRVERAGAEVEFAPGRNA